MIKHSLSVLPLRKDAYQAKMGFLLFLVTLSVFFLASLIAYLLIRFSDRPANFGLTLSIPSSLWVSTLIMGVISYMLHRAIGYIRFEKQVPFRRCLMICCCLAGLFLLLQTLGLSQLWQQHQLLAEKSAQMEGLMFILVLVHALHVFGGMISLSYVTHKAVCDGYDHEKFWGVGLCADYWHFLGVVWIAMLLTFLLSI